MSFRFVLTGAALAALFLVSACGQAPAEESHAQPAPVVQTAAPLSLEIADWDEFTGRFESPQQVTIRARVSGYLEEVHVVDGALVEEGDLLFTLDQRPYQAAANAARGRAQQARATRDQAQADLNRAQRLREADAISEEELEQARTASATAQAAYAAAQADAQSAALELEYTEIRAPITGRLSQRTVDPGDLVSAAGDPMITVVQTDPLQFPFYASEAIFLRYQREEGAGLGAPVQVRLQDEVEFTHDGELNFINNAVEAGTGSILMRAEFANEDGLIRPGMLGTIRVRGSAPYQAQLVPKTVIFSDATRRYVFVLGEGDTATVQMVTLGPVIDNLQVVHGLPADAPVLVSGLQNLRPGTQVQVRPGGEIVHQPNDEQAGATLQTRPAGSARIAH
jgi:RND family efflux transporter MFP subunit